MKQKDLLKRFYANGWWLLRQGGNHMLLTNGKEIESIPRHREVNEKLANSLIKRRNLK